MPKPTAKTVNPFDVLNRAYGQHGIRQVCVGYSGGKDATATLAVCIDRFGAANVFPYFMYIVPGLSFQEKYLAYIERLFGILVTRLPHWVLSQLMRGSSFRHPTRAAETMPRVTIRDIEQHVRKLSGFAWVVSGEKACDSLERNAQIRNVDGINRQRKKFWPLAYWQHSQVFAFLKQRSIALPPEYGNATAGRSFSGLWNREVSWVRDRYPEDWLKIKAVFPLIEAQVMRYELRTKRKSQAAK